MGLANNDIHLSKTTRPLIFCATHQLENFIKQGYRVAEAERELESRRTQRAADGLVRCEKCNALIETTVHCDNCGTFEPTRR